MASVFLTEMARILLFVLILILVKENPLIITQTFRKSLVQLFLIRIFFKEENNEKLDM